MWTTKLSLLKSQTVTEATCWNQITDDQWCFVYISTVCFNGVHRTSSRHTSLLWIVLSGAHRLSVTGVERLNGRDLFSIVGLCSASIRLLLCDRVGTHTVNTFWMYNIAHKHRKKRRTLGGQGTCEYFCVHELCLHRIMHFMVWMNCVCAHVCFWMCLWFKEHCIRADWRLLQAEKDRLSWY